MTHPADKWKLSDAERQWQALRDAAPELYEIAGLAPCECDYDHSCRRCRVLAKARGEQP